MGITYMILSPKCQNVTTHNIHELVHLEPKASSHPKSKHIDTRYNEMAICITERQEWRISSSHFDKGNEYGKTWWSVYLKEYKAAAGRWLDAMGVA